MRFDVASSTLWYGIITDYHADYQLKSNEKRWSESGELIGEIKEYFGATYAEYKKIKNAVEALLA